MAVEFGYIGPPARVPAVKLTLHEPEPEPRPPRPEPQRYRLKWQDGSVGHRELRPDSEELASLVVRAGQPDHPLVSVEPVAAPRRKDSP